MSDTDMLGAFLVIRVDKIGINVRERKLFVKVTVIRLENGLPQETYLTLHIGDRAYFTENTDVPPIWTAFMNPEKPENDEEPTD